jgi:hypothetical protein
MCGLDVSYQVSCLGWRVWSNRGLGWRVWSNCGLGWRVLSNRGLGWRVLSNRGLGWRVLSNRGLGWRVWSNRGFFSVQFKRFSWLLITICVFTYYSDDFEEVFFIFPVDYFFSYNHFRAWNWYDISPCLILILLWTYCAWQGA